MLPLFFLNYFQIFPVDVMLVEGRMLCHCRFVKALVLRMSYMLSQPCLEPFISKSIWLVNMSSSILTETQKPVLEKGLNFPPAPTNCNVPKIEIVAAVESVLRKMGSQPVAEVYRSKVSNILRRSPPPESNILPKERTALKELKRE